MKRILLLATAIAAVATVACGEDKEAAFERGEIGDAINASESLTVHFTDSVHGRLPVADTTKPSDVGVLVADACARTDSISTVGWKRRELGELPVTMLLPSDYARVPRGRGEPPDSVIQIFRTPDGDELTVMRRADAFDLVDLPEGGKESTCLVDIEKMRVHVETGRQLPTGDIKTLSASYHLPTGGWFVVHGRAHDMTRQHEQLRILREVRFVRLWQRPLS